MSLNDILKKDKKIDWVLFLSRHREVPTLFAYLNASSQWPPKWMNQVNGVNFGFRYQKRVGDEWFWSKKELSKLVGILEIKGNSDSKYYLKTILVIEKYCKDLYGWSKKVSRIDYKKVNNKELLKDFKSYWEKLRSVASFLLVKHVLNRVLETRIKQELTKILEQGNEVERLGNYFEKILVPTKRTLITEGHFRLKGIDKKDHKAIRKWLQKYNWIDTFYWSGQVLNEKNILKKIDFLKKEKHIEPINHFSQIKKSLHLTGGLLDYIKALPVLLYVHTYELECLFASKYWFQNLLEEVAGRIGFSFDNYIYATYTEISDALRGFKLDKKRILQRKSNQFALFRLDNCISIFEAEDFRKIVKRKDILNFNLNEINGSIAFSGNVRGRAKVIKTIYEFEKFKKGDILITPMTTVDFVPFLKKARAIVTDEGGITCHAAIISRELKKPCIIGTRIATQVFQDGDRVEVDAEKGVVRKL